jgi:hypothetical protein
MGCRASPQSTGDIGARVWAGYAVWSSVAVGSPWSEADFTMWSVGVEEAEAQSADEDIGNEPSAVCWVGGLEGAVGFFVQMCERLMDFTIEISSCSRQMCFWC